MINLIPMAGRGQRFISEGYRVPKPFIPVMGRPMFLTATRSLPPATDTVFVCLAEHAQRYPVQEQIQRSLPQARVVMVSGQTEGQACTCLAAEPILNKGDGLLIASCDYETVYDAKRYGELFNDPRVDLIIWTFRYRSLPMPNPVSFAYCRIANGRVIEVVEKRPISDRPWLDSVVVGSFTFRSTELFLRAARAMIAKNIRVQGEFCVATSLNQLIEEGVRVVPFEVEQFISFGSPEELRRFLYWEEYFSSLEGFDGRDGAGLIDCASLL